MSITNEQQNILDNLKTPIKSFRIFALEEIIKSGDSSEFLVALDQLKLTETDSECLSLISHAINSVKGRLEGDKKELDNIDYSNTSVFLSKWNKADDNLRMSMISNLPLRLPKDFKTLGPQLLSGSSPIVAARVIRLFGRSWPEGQFNLITDNLSSGSLVLKLAAIRTMVHLKPELLLNDLPVLLASSDPEIKALAIRGLAKIDKEEALNHLQALLLSPMQTDRHAGIQNCPFLPFEMVKPLLLKYFAAETNPELLTKAGWIIEMNPDIQIPFMLFEIAERSPEKKANLVKKVLNEAVNLLDKSGILGNQFAAYMRKLQDWVSKRTALRYVRQVVPRLDTDKVATEVEKNIIVSLKQPAIKSAFNEALNWPISDRVKNRIKDYLNGKFTNQPQKSSSAILTDKKEAGQVSNKTQNLSQLEILASITPEKASERLNQILLLVSHKGSSDEIRIAALQCLTRCRLSGAEDKAVSLIKNPNIAIATAAVEYLGIVNPDYIFPYLGQCLKVSDVGMKSAALGILKNFDYNQAISYLRAMLYSTDMSQQKMAMECINQFDFALVRDMLTDFICRDYHEDLIEAGLCHFAANPSAENVYSLYKIEQAHVGKIAEQAKALREACPEAVEEESTTLFEPKTVSKQSNKKEEQSKLQEKNKEETKEVKKVKEAELKERLRIEKEKKASKRPAYAYSSKNDMPERTSKQQLLVIWGMISEFVASKALPITIIAFIIIVTFIYYTFFYTGNSNTDTKKSVAIISEPLIIEGEVIKENEGIVVVKATNDETYILTPLNDGWKIPDIGRLVRGQIIPYRRAGSGEVVAKFTENGYIYITNYSKQFSGDKAK